jgi:hypothetical protein
MSLFDILGITMSIALVVLEATPSHDEVVEAFMDKLARLAEGDNSFEIAVTTLYTAITLLCILSTIVGVLMTSDEGQGLALPRCELLGELCTAIASSSYVAPSCIH